MKKKEFNNGFSFGEVPWKIYKKQKTNQIFKLLPIREEGGDWEDHLQNILLELGGIDNLEKEESAKTIEILANLASLYDTKDDSVDTFVIYRKVIFETLALIEEW